MYIICIHYCKINITLYSYKCIIMNLMYTLIYTITKDCANPP